MGLFTTIKRNLPSPFILHVIALWLCVVVLAMLSAVALVASSSPSDCNSDSFNTSITSITLTPNACTSKERLSAVVHYHSSYFQSIQITVISFIVILSLLVFKPSLQAMTWSSLETSVVSQNDMNKLTMKLSTFQTDVDLVNSPGLLSSLTYIKELRSLAPSASFVLVVSLLSHISAIAVSPIYKSHEGPFTVNASLPNGGGIGPTPSPNFDPTNLVPVGIAAGRSLISAGTTLNTTVSPITFDANVSPFIPLQTIQVIWHAQVEAVVARSSVDCGPSAPMLLANKTQNIVTLDANFFEPNQGVNPVTTPTFAGQVLGYITNDPQVTVVYLNNVVNVSTGVVEAQTSVIFLAANGTLEGAQQTITSTDPTSRIQFADVLVCTSATRLETSICTIDRGVVTSCDFLPPTNVPSGSTTGGVEVFVGNPKAVAMTLAASPVTAYYSLPPTRLPMYLAITEAMISSQTLPMSFLSENVAGPPYNLTMSYVTDVLFPQTAHGLVQGIVTSPHYANQQVSLIATFGASNPGLICAIMFISFICALVSTLASTLPRAARHAPPLNVPRILAISLNPELEVVLQPYSDRNVDIEDKVLDARVGYGWVERLNRHALLITPPHPGITSMDDSELEMSLLPVG